MSYSESNGQVILTMSREDYDKVLMMLGLATGYLIKNSGVSPICSERLDECLALMNRLNSGNPHYTPYQVEEKK